MLENKNILIFSYKNELKIFYLKLRTPYYYSLIASKFFSVFYAQYVILYIDIEILLICNKK